MIHQAGQVLSLWKGPIDVSMTRIALAIAEREGLTIEQLRGKRLPSTLSVFRQEAAWRMTRAGKTSPQIARFLERNHATILRDLKLYEARLLEGIAA